MQNKIIVVQIENGETEDRTVENIIVTGLSHNHFNERFYQPGPLNCAPLK